MADIDLTSIPGELGKRVGKHFKNHLTLLSEQDRDFELSKNAMKAEGLKLYVREHGTTYILIVLFTFPLSFASIYMGIDYVAYYLADIFGDMSYNFAIGAMVFVELAKIQLSKVVFDTVLKEHLLYLVVKPQKAAALLVLSALVFTSYYCATEGATIIYEKKVLDARVENFDNYSDSLHNDALTEYSRDTAAMYTAIKNGHAAPKYNEMIAKAYHEIDSMKADKNACWYAGKFIKPCREDVMKIKENIRKWQNAAMDKNAAYELRKLADLGKQLESNKGDANKSIKRVEKKNNKKEGHELLIVKILSICVEFLIIYFGYYKKNFTVQVDKEFKALVPGVNHEYKQLEQAVEFGREITGGISSVELQKIGLRNKQLIAAGGDASKITGFAVGSGQPSTTPSGSYIPEIKSCQYILCGKAITDGNASKKFCTPKCKGDAHKLKTEGKITMEAIHNAAKLKKAEDAKKPDDAEKTAQKDAGGSGEKSDESSISKMHPIVKHFLKYFS